MPSSRRRTLAPALIFTLAAALLAVAALAFWQGRAPGLLPEGSWGAWRNQEVSNWSTHVRVNTWVHAAEARVHMGKAEEITLEAYGRTARGTTTMDGTTFTLTPEGKITGTRQ
ncbi:MULTISPECIES: hypothetical protein [unclassified Streptomyces]|uniref:hypothetical protein n=1 Tax=unclassified Streptomyces TaxID=2593676 RepID=UPI001BE4FFD2|nr:MULTISPECIES: hypothetical protein [unclassified Streptomyces]MBT2408510.1 hypothetical protein [Streptomyces sp. ISL-21]MBT2459677.1 hypothetical protein [Streptomyces sp. ISL-86]MBT2611947.1 hypothetical protein [Streptomyces sp. ISL-87]